MARVDEKPTGVCTLCDRPAMQWIGRLIPLGDGRTVRQVAAVCELHGLLQDKPELAQ